MRSKTIYNISLRCILIVVLLLSIGLQRIRAAGTISLYVGQSQIVSAPNPSQGALYAVTWASRHASVSVSNYSTYGGQVTVNSYFTGTAQIQCDYYWRWYSGSRMYTNHATTYYNVTCRSVSLTASPASMTLNPGQGSYITYSLSPSISPTPSVRMYSNNTSVATVNASGYVYAVGPGSTTITIENSAGPSATCYVSVNEILVSEAYVSSPISIYADQQQSMSVTTYPSNAKVSSRYWSIADGSDYISLTSSGTLTGKKPGTARIYCTVNGRVTSNVATVYVSEPSFTVNQLSPADNSTDVSAFVTPSATYSLALYEGNNFSNISLKNSSGTNVAGTVSISGKTVTFKPSKPLAEQTDYTLSIPANAVKNKWNTHCSSEVTLNFKTGDYTNLTLSASLPSGFVEKGSSVKLTASQSNAKIYYTTDGKTPTANSMVYSGAITIDKDMELRAVAVCDGYRQSDVLAVDYVLSNVEFARTFPVDNAPMFLYDDVIPFVLFSNRMVPGSNIDDVTLTKNGMTVEVEAIVNDSTLFIVPEEPLRSECTYTVTIPADAVMSWQGEGCKASSWTFKTGNFAAAVSTGSPELGTAIRTDGSLWTWGHRITEANATDGSYSYITQENAGCFVDADVVAVSSGYMHHALIKRDGSLWMWGRQYCGEFGNGSTTASAQPIKIMDGIKSVSCGLQTTAIVKQDGTLWMCGRNDLGQIDESYMVRQQYVMVDEGVEEATLSWGAIKVVKNDGTTETRVWDTEIDSQRQPSMPTNFGVDFEEVEFGWKNAVALGKDGSVWAWQDSTQGEDSDITPTMIIEGRKSSELEGLDIVNPVIFLNEGGRSVITALPKPLTADYTALSWTSSDDNVAVVSQKGIVTAVALGKAILTVTITGTTGETYKEECKVIVSDALLLKAKSYAREYGEENPVFEYTVEGGGVDGEPEIVCEAEVTSPVGDYPIIIRKGNVQNHNDNYEDGVLTITKASLTVDVGTYTKRQFEPMPQFSPVFIGFKNDETEDVLTKPVLLSCDADEDSAPGEYAIVASGADADNYEIQYVVGTLIVTEAATYSLVYLVDGEEYLRLPIKHRDVIIPLSEPTKEGYTFGGWSEIPTTMPAHDVEVTGTFYLYGDVNTDTKVNVVDVVDIARFVVDTPSENFRDKLADLNRDLTVNIADAVVLVNHIAGDQNLVKAEVPIGKPHDYKACGLELQAREMNELSLCLTGDADFTAFQLEIDVPDGMEISDMRINGQRKDGHQLLYNKVSDNRYRVAALSLSNAVFKDKDGELLNISFKGAGLDAICINDIHFVTTNGTDISFEALHVNANATSVPSVDKAKKGMDNVFDLSGRKLPRPQKGVNIVGGKKVFVR